LKSNYNSCLQKVLKDEGGYTNDPADSGGPTNFGITLSDYRRYVDKTGTALNVRNMTVDEAKIIYKSKYWDALGCDDLPSGVDYTVFDYGVNSGLGRSRKALQRFNSLSGTKLIDAINDERTAFLQAIGVGKNSKFLRGWLARVERVRSYSKTLAANKVAGPATGSGIAASGVGLSQFWHNHEYLIIGGALGLALLIGTAIHIYKNRK
jgi:lysozyme family protein